MNKVPFLFGDSPENLEITAFGVSAQIRVVISGACDVEDAQFSALSLSRFDHDVFKGVRRDQTGTGACDEKTAGFYALKSQRVEVVVLLDAFFEIKLIASVNELRRVKQNCVEHFAIANHLAGVGEGIRVDEVYLCLVDVGVALGECDGFFVEIDADHFRGVALKFGCDGESPCITAEFQEGFAFQ